MSVKEFWAAYCDWAGVAAAMPEVTTFGDGLAQQEELCALVLAGRKRATAALALWYGWDRAMALRAGTLEIVLDGAGAPRAVIELTEVFEAPFAAVTAAFAAGEGEGDGSLQYWMAGHRRFFEVELAAEGLTIAETVRVMFQRFRLVWVGGRSVPP